MYIQPTGNFYYLLKYAAHHTDRLDNCCANHCDDTAIPFRPPLVSHICIYSVYIYTASANILFVSQCTHMLSAKQAKHNYDKQGGDIFNSSYMYTLTTCVYIAMFSNCFKNACLRYIITLNSEILLTILCQTVVSILTTQRNNMHKYIYSTYNNTCDTHTCNTIIMI